MEILKISVSVFTISLKRASIYPWVCSHIHTHVHIHKHTRVHAHISIHSVLLTVPQSATIKPPPLPSHIYIRQARLLDGRVSSGSFRPHPFLIPAAHPFPSNKPSTCSSPFYHSSVSPTSQCETEVEKMLQRSTTFDRPEVDRTPIWMRLNQSRRTQFYSLIARYILRNNTISLSAGRIAGMWSISGCRLERVADAGGLRRWRMIFPRNLFESVLFTE